MSDRLFIQMLNTVTCDCIDVLPHLPDTGIDFVPIPPTSLTYPQLPRSARVAAFVPSFRHFQNGASLFTNVVSLPVPRYSGTLPNRTPDSGSPPTHSRNNFRETTTDDVAQKRKPAEAGLLG
jgi:hypothetical protein